MDEIYINFRDLPEWAKEILRKEGKRPRSIPVLLSTKPEVGGRPGTCLHLFNGEEVIEIKGATEAGVWANDLENAVCEGGEVTLPNPDCMILEVYYFVGELLCSLYAHPNSVMKALGGREDLTNIQKAVLVATRMYKPSYGGIKDYRYYELGRGNNISYEAWAVAKATLMQTKHLNMKGAITTKGLNVIRGMDQFAVQKLFEEE